MNKTAIKNFAIWARNKLIADISYKAGLLGVTEKGIKSPLPQSTQTVQFFDIGTKEPSSITGVEIQQRKKLVEEIERKVKQSDYVTAYKNVIEEVAYTWFNRLIAIRFMEVNDYLPTRIRALSSESNGKSEPDLVTHALEANLEYSAYEKDRIIQLKHENKLDELFRMLFIKQCNALNANLPELFEKTCDYTELLLNVSFTDIEGVIYHLVNDVSEDDFNISKEGQVEIIGWLYQYYNTEPKDETFALLKKNVKITKDRIPAATQLFTPDWIVRYMVENSLGRLWLGGHPNDSLKSNWKYFLDEAEQQEDVQKQLNKIRGNYQSIKPEDIKIIDPAMGSGHILVYAFDVLMQIYESYGFNQRDAAKSIVENNLYGLDIDNRAYQLAYFAVMMKARQYNRRIINEDTKCNLFSIQESNGVDRKNLMHFVAGMDDVTKNTALLQLQGLLDTFLDAKEYGSILNVENYNWELLNKIINSLNLSGQMSLESLGIENTQSQLLLFIKIGKIMTQKYDVVVTNPPYMGSSSMGELLLKYVKRYYTDSKSDLFAVMIEKCCQMTKRYGYCAMITQHVWMFLSRLENLRAKIIKKDIITMAHLGARAFEEIGGEVVQTTTFVLCNSNVSTYIGRYNRLVDYNSQSRKEAAFLSKSDTYYARKEDFIKIPGAPIAYWASNKLVNGFSGDKLSDMAVIRQGLATGDNNMFLRLWFEVSAINSAYHCHSVEEVWTNNKKFVPITKGGSFRKWYGNHDYVIAFDESNYKLLSNAGNNLPSRQLYFQEGITWSNIAVKATGFRKFPQGFVFSNKGAAIFTDDKLEEQVLIAFLNSVVSIALLQLISPSIGFEPGYIASLTLKKMPLQTKGTIGRLVKEAIEISKNDWDAFEYSWDFLRNPLCNKSTIESAYDIWKANAQNRFDRLKEIEEELNYIFTQIYNLEEELVSCVDDNDITVRRADLQRDIRLFISYAVGCMFGRFSLDVGGIAFAGGEWDPHKFSTFIPDSDNILPITDEEYFEDDVVSFFVRFVENVYGAETLEQNLNYIAKALGNKGNSSREKIRNYFVKDFFLDHCSNYSVTGSGKRPIYWLFDSGKQNGFKALIYMHRYNENTIGNLRIDYLHRMQRIYENEIARMQDTIENSGDAREVTAATKRKEKLIKQLQETKEYDEKIAHLALARTSIDLDDGVKVNYEKIQTDREGKKLDVLAKI